MAAPVAQLQGAAFLGTNRLLVLAAAAAGAVDWDAHKTAVPTVTKDLDGAGSVQEVLDDWDLQRAPAVGAVSGRQLGC